MWDDRVDAWNPSIERVRDFRREVHQKRKSSICQAIEKARKHRRIRIAKVRSSLRNWNKGEKKRRRGEGPVLQLNCYDIIRGDPSGTGSGSAFARGGKADDWWWNEEGERYSEGGKESRSDSNCDENSNCRCKPFILRLGPWCHLTSSFRDLRLFLELAPRGFVSFLFPFLRFLISRAAFPCPSPPFLSASTPQPQPSAAQRSAGAHSVLMLSSVTWAQFSAPLTGRAEIGLRTPRTSPRIAFHHLSRRLPGTGYLLAWCSSRPLSGSLSFNRVNTAPFSYSRELNACTGMVKYCC